MGGTEGGCSVQAVSPKLLGAMAASMPEDPTAMRRNGSDRIVPRVDFGLDEWIREHGVPVKRSGAWKRNGYRYILEECPWKGHADNSAYIVRGPGGRISAGRQHHSRPGPRR